jgi:hypothetical protein
MRASDQKRTWIARSRERLDQHREECRRPGVEVVSSKAGGWLKGESTVAKTWRQKLEGGKPAHVEVLDKPFGGARPGARMLVGTPRLVDEYMRRVPEGDFRTVAQMRADLAKQHGADIACPLSTSIFARIAAEAALEELQAGQPSSEVTPFWRVVDERSTVAKKLSCGPEFIKIQRRLEAPPGI